MRSVEKNSSAPRRGAVPGRLVALALVLLAGAAAADVGPPGPKWHCSPPDTCRSCASFDEACAGDAVDAGLSKADCQDTIGTPTSYYCPPGTNVGRYCSCSAVEAPVVAGLFGLVAWLRRRAVKRGDKPRVDSVRREPS
jgi:hypothetical protein